MAIGNIGNVSDAAEIIGCTENRVRQLCESGELVAEKFNGWAWAIDLKSAKKYAKIEQKRGRPRGSKNISKSA